MTPAQRAIVDGLSKQGFTVTYRGDVVRMNRGADRRVIRADGSQKRGQHDEQGRPENAKH